MDYPLILGGIEVRNSEKLEILSPYDNSLIGKVSIATDEIIDHALENVRISFDDTRDLCANHKEHILNKAKDLLQERSEEFSRTITQEMGKTIHESRGEVSRALETLKLSAALLREPLGEVIPFDSAPNATDKWGFYKRFPLGPVLAITPFNFPLNLAMHKIGPAIATGNPIILKPASKTSITGILLGKLLIDAGYPRKAINVLPGPGGIIGDRLVGDDRIKVVTFTGSAEVGKAIVKKAGLKHISMELGSNSAVIVMSDADILHAANRIIKGAMALAGQVCISVQRVYAEVPIYEKLVELLTLAAKNIKLGDPLNEQTEMGPMISEADTKRTDGLIEEAVLLGGEITTGGEHNGTLFQPTVLINVPQHAKIIQTEAFAPIVVINKISDLNEGIALVNDSEFGLQAGIFTRDINSAHSAFRKINVGGVIINDVPTFRADIMPYGGIKDSGLGREGPRYAIEHMTYIKVCAIHNSDYE